MNKKEITFQQFKDAGDYLKSYGEFIGVDDFPNYDLPKPKDLPEDVSKAWDTVVAFDKQLDERGIII